VKKLNLVAGWIVTFTLFPAVAYTQVTDIEGNTYKTVQIGTQLWMAENLKTTKYNNGTAVPLVTGSEWYTMTTHGYCWYKNDYKTFGKTYGALYNYYTVEKGNLCPTGWHVPTDQDWEVLSNYLGGENSAGNKLKENGTIHWKSPNAGVTNSFGFSALPGGGRWVIGRFDLIGRKGYWWSSTAYENNSDASIRMIQFDESYFKRVPYLKGSGFSIRCIKDQ
jgi:uncharacterized protein (TIGR02145 family)